MKYTDINNLDFSPTEWLSSLGFYHDTLEIEEKRLSEVVSRNTHKEVLQGIEHFQNQFEIQKANISKYKHRINAYAHECKKDIQAHAGKVNTALKAEQETLKDELRSFENRIKDLRLEFNLFLTKWM